MYELSRRGSIGEVASSDLSLTSMNAKRRLWLGAVLLFAMSAPFAMQLGGADPEGSLQQSVKPYYLYIRVSLLVLLIIWAVNEPQILLRTIRSNPWPEMLWGLVILSSFWSNDAYITVRASIELFVCVLFAYVLATRYDSRSIAIMLLNVLGLSLILSVVWAGIFPSIAIHGDFDVVQEGHAGSWRGIYVHKNMLGAVAGLALPLVMGPGRALLKSRALSIAYLAAALLCLVQAKSGGGYLVTAVCYFAVGLTSVRPMIARNTAIVIAGLAAIVGAIFLDDISSFVLDLLDKDQTLTGRTDLWLAALELIAQSPIVGYGFPSVSDPQIADVFLRAHHASNAHNAYLQILIESGVIGISIWLLALFCAIRGALPEFNNESITQETAVFVSILFSLFVSGFGEISEMSFTTTPSGMFWLVVVVAAARRNEPPSASLHPFGGVVEPDPGGATATSWAHHLARRNKITS